MSTLHQLARIGGKQINRALRHTGVKIVRAGPQPFVEFKDYLPFAETLQAAGAANMSVGDYVDATYNRAGVTAETIDRLKTAGVLNQSRKRICEIGPGSGRYLERTIAACHPDHYEIYETAVQWRDYLTATYPAVARDADGVSLAATASSTIDLVQAHKVFPGVPLLGTLRYLREMVRVATLGGCVVFDAVTESCLDGETAERFLELGVGYQAYPSLVSRQCLLDFFQQRSFVLVTSFMMPMEPGRTEVFAFRREAS
jgi:hypothetical protein